MRRHRTTARGILVSLLLIGLAVAASATSAADTHGGTQGSGKVPRLVFPLVAKVELWDNWGDPRPQGSHEGIDIAAERRSPLVAVEPGRVEYATSGLGGCMLYLYGRSGTMYLYIHLNNDVTARNDNRGGCKLGTAYAVRDGARVGAGEHVGMTGDSGDQDGNPGLHFEVHPNGGEDVNPFPYLKRAVKPLFAAREGVVFSLGLRGDLVAAGGGTVAIEVDRVRQYPGGKWLDVDPRTVVLTVPLGEEVPPALDQASSAAKLVTLRASRPATVFTLKANATMDAIAGAPGALLLGRVVLGK